jgi:aminoglycoside phosphotransferase (APT) family kinase protein
MDEKNQPSAIRQYRNLAKTIVEQYFGKPASRIVYKPTGLTNYVFAVNHVEGQFVVRISPDPERIKVFKKELWASRKAREAGVPTPEVLAVGNDAVSEPYMITRRVTGSEATHVPNRSHIVQEMESTQQSSTPFVRTALEVTSIGPAEGQTLPGIAISKMNSHSRRGSKPC